jgi:hypothetical protein
LRSNDYARLSTAARHPRPKQHRDAQTHSQTRTNPFHLPCPPDLKFMVALNCRWFDHEDTKAQSFPDLLPIGLLAPS